MNQPLRIGLVGAGMVSRHHLIAWASISDQARVVAVADPSADNAARRAGEFGIAQTYPSAEAMLAATELDAIDIAAPREMHAPLVRLAAKRQLPVLCQKPLAPNLQEATDLAAEVADQTRLMVHENWRFRGYYRDAAAWLREGRIGNVKQAQLTLLTSGVLPGPDGLCPALERQPFMRGERRMLVAEVLIHHLDTLRMLLGPLRVTAARLSRSSDQLVGEDGAVIQLEDATAAPAFRCSPALPRTGIRPPRSTASKFSATRARSISTGRGSPAPAPRRASRSTISPSNIRAPTIERSRISSQSLRDNTPFETAPQDNLETLRLVEDCYRLSGWEALR